MPSPTQARTMFRSAARYLTEQHPFARNPTTMPSHSIRYLDLNKRVVKASALYFPFAVGVLGWPVAAAWWFNGSM
ncbi:hypothetical protein P153DRAFT_371363 [Dothidotthia symphoricarpi CBS 119687]|uniref:Uncharacterized protein n=1 Tax=Dothidotthia symphoricarpi CBS 119687 TaxID=1392245 RepID=A0A6A5ZYH0_9PLEO|nr:uncharacterized protein P153DRAFT_371363 [Dothidotthia symphoricarpi CBS 119687]KAF2124065.1 hypothetical protein P153DRAFT_371363 [Dothidotthia symphoricarpi CBS 119687]